MKEATGSGWLQGWDLVRMWEGWLEVLLEGDASICVCAVVRVGS